MNPGWIVGIALCLLPAVYGMILIVRPAQMSAWAKRYYSRQRLFGQRFADHLASMATPGFIQIMGLGFVFLSVLLVMAGWGPHLIVGED